MSTEALKATDDYSATLSTHPRVTLAQMEARIVDKRVFNVGGALAALALESGVLPQAPKADSPLRLLTICVLVLDNGWTVMGKSAPASAENFNAEKGAVFAYEDAIRQLWPLEGYLLRERLWIAGVDQRAATGEAG